MTPFLTPCGEDQPAAPPNIVGSYTTAFTVTKGGTTTSVLAQGGALALVLNPQGATGGYLHIPGSVTGDVDEDDDLTGTWTRSGNTVKLDHTAETFLRDMPLTIQGGSLVGDRTFRTFRVQVTLIRILVATHFR